MIEAEPIHTVSSSSADPRPPNLTFDLVAASAAGTLEPEWRALLDGALDDTPFLRPEFLLPAANHAADGGVELLAIREEDGSLAGLFPLTGLGAGAPDIWARPRLAALWRHPLQPFTLPLLAGPTEKARRATAAFLDWLADRPALGGFDAAMLPAGSAAATLLLEEATARSLPVQRRRQVGPTRGLHFKPQELHGAVDRIAVATGSTALHGALEHLLCLDREEAPSQAILLRDPLLPALLRAAVRGFGRQGGAAIALSDESDARAGALVLLGRSRGYLWRLFGPDAADPAVEAALAVAAERRIGLPIVSASVRPLAGAGSEAMPTESLVIGLRPEHPSVVGRMRMWLGSGLFGMG